MSSLANQEAELRAAAGGELVRVFKDVGSGLSERRRGLERMLAAAGKGSFDVLWVTHEDRLARFGAGFLRLLLHEHGVSLRVLHDHDGAGAEEELVRDFVALAASFSGRLYGQRSAAARRRLLAQAGGAR